jgi:membrane-associated phospholipid phosphatase
MVRPVAVVAALCALVVITLGLVFGDKRTGSWLDQQVYLMVYKQFVGDRELLQAMLVPTEPVLLIVVLSLVVMVAVARRRPRLAVLAVAGPLLAVSLNGFVLKPLIGRTINNGSLAFPSGHTTGMVAMLTVLTLAVVTCARPSWRASLTALVIAGSVMVTTVGATALTGMRYHYATDTAGGACLAVATVLAVALGIDRLAAKRRRPAAAAASGVAL